MLLFVLPASRQLAAALRTVFGFAGVEFRVAKDGRQNECDRVSVGDAAVLWDAGGGYVMGMVRQLVAITCPPRMPQPFHAALVERWARHGAGSSHGASGSGWPSWLRRMYFSATAQSPPLRKKSIRSTLSADWMSMAGETVCTLAPIVNSHVRNWH